MFAKIFDYFCFEISFLGTGWLLFVLIFFLLEMHELSKSEEKDFPLT